MADVLTSDAPALDRAALPNIFGQSLPTPAPARQPERPRRNFLATLGNIADALARAGGAEPQYAAAQERKARAEMGERVARARAALAANPNDETAFAEWAAIDPDGAVAARNALAPAGDRLEKVGQSLVRIMPGGQVEEVFTAPSPSSPSADMQLLNMATEHFGGDRAKALEWFTRFKQPPRPVLAPRGDGGRDIFTFDPAASTPATGAFQRVGSTTGRPAPASRSAGSTTGQPAPASRSAGKPPEFLVPKGENRNVLKAGEFSDVRGMIETLARAESMLASQNVSGPIIGAIPDRALPFANPAARATRDLVASVTQRNLKGILGGQFAMKEGEQLIQRAYDPSLGEKENLTRVRALRQAIEGRAKEMFVRVYSPEDAAALPVGTRFVTPDNRVWTRK